MGDSGKMLQFLNVGQLRCNWVSADVEVTPVLRDLAFYPPGIYPVNDLTL